MKKLLQFQPTYVTKVFLKSFPKIHREDINYGTCFIWAYLAHKMYCNIQLWSLDSNIQSHAWVYYHGKFYDSDSPRGVKHFSQLRNLSNRTQPKSYPAARNFCQDFQLSWESSLKITKNSLTWNKLDCLAKKAIYENRF